jgi:hypothetical protein
MVGDEPHLVADRELFETAIGDAVAMEIDLVAIGGLDKAAILLGEEACNPAVVRHRMQLYLTAPLANVIFEQAAGGIERVADGDMGIFMRMMGRRIATDDNLSAGNRKIDANPKQIALLAPRVLAFDDDPASCDPVIKAFEFLGAVAYPRRNGLRAVHMAKSDLKWDLHRILLVQWCVALCWKRCGAASTSPTARVSRMSVGPSQPPRSARSTAKCEADLAPALHHIGVRHRH